MPAAPQVPRWFVDENSLGVAKALAYVRGDVTWPRSPRRTRTRRAADTAWLPIVGQAGLVVLTRDKRIRSRPLERQALLDHGVRACFLTSGGSLDLFSQLQLWLRYWDDIEALVAEQPAPWLASVTRTGVRVFDTPVAPADNRPDTRRVTPCRLHEAAGQRGARRWGYGFNSVHGVEPGFPHIRPTICAPTGGRG